MLPYWEIFLGLMIVAGIPFALTRFDDIERMLMRLSRNLHSARRCISRTYAMRIYRFQQRIYEKTNDMRIWTGMPYSLTVSLRTYGGYLSAASYLILFFQSMYWSFYDIESTRTYILCAFISSMIFLLIFTGRREQQFFRWIIGDINNVFYLPLLSFRFFITSNIFAVLFIFQSFNAVIERAMFVIESYRRSMRQPASLDVNGVDNIGAGQIHETNLHTPILRFFRFFTIHIRRIIGLMHEFQTDLRWRRGYFRLHAQTQQMIQNNVPSNIWFGLIHTALYLVACFYALFYTATIFTSFLGVKNTYSLGGCLITGVLFLFLLRFETERPQFIYWLIQDMDAFLCVPGVLFYFYPDFWDTAAVMFSLRCINIYMDYITLIFDGFNFFKRQREQHAPEEN